MISPDLMRGDVAWYMQLEDVILGHELGFDYPIQGNRRLARVNVHQQKEEAWVS